MCAVHLPSRTSTGSHPLYPLQVSLCPGAVNGQYVADVMFFCFTLSLHLFFRALVVLESLLSGILSGTPLWRADRSSVLPRLSGWPLQSPRHDVPQDSAPPSSSGPGPTGTAPVVDEPDPGSAPPGPPRLPHNRTSPYCRALFAGPEPRGSQCLLTASASRLRTKWGHKDTEAFLRDYAMDADGSAWMVSGAPPWPRPTPTLPPPPIRPGAGAGVH